MKTLAELQERLSQLVYRPGWQMRLYEGVWEGIQFHCITVQEDTTKPGTFTTLDIRSPLPPMLTIEQFDLWLSKRLIRIESHESREWLREKETGKALFYPHVNDQDNYDIEAFKKYRDTKS